MKFIQVTIGRNISNRFVYGVKPLPAWKWAEFQIVVDNAVRQFAAETGNSVEFSEVHRGVGEWDGVKEESAKITVYFEGPDTAFDVAQGLADTARAWCLEYQQDAVAIAEGDSHLTYAVEGRA